MNKSEIIERISKLRTKRNLSARALSVKLGKNEAYINRLEQKKDFLPTMESFFDILEVCEISPEEFFYYDINQYKQDKEIIDLLSLVDNESKQAILTLLKKAKK